MTEKMTEAQIEVAARTLCRLDGVDPDALVQHGADPDKYGIALAVLQHSPAWTRAARHIRSAERIALAIEAGRDSDPESPDGPTA